MKNRKTRSAMRRMLFTLALVLVVAVASVGGTIAWLKVETTPVVNTFTVGDINITLTETDTTTVDGKQTKQFKIIPGVNLDKDPKVTVTAGSEPCYVFVKVTEANWPTFATTEGEKLVKYTIAAGWAELSNATNDGSKVYWKKVDAAANSDVVAATELPILKDNKVYVSGALTKEQVEEITTTPTLTFVAYAVQQAGSTNATEAWAKVSGT